MEVVNPFILKNKERMIVFLDQLSSVTDPFLPPSGIDMCNNSSASANSDTGELKNKKKIQNLTEISNLKLEKFEKKR